MPNGSCRPSLLSPAPDQADAGRFSVYLQWMLASTTAATPPGPAPCASITPLSHYCHSAPRSVRWRHGLASVGFGGEPVAGVPRSQGGAARADGASPMG